MGQVFQAVGDRSTSDLTREHVLIPWEAQGGPPRRIIDHAEGCYLYAPDGTRILDFASGLVYGLDGKIELVANRVYLLTPANVEVSAEEREKIAGGMFYNQF